ncbi:MAG: purine-binding chemotaxis protein CheW [Vicinamibacteria bacterium]|nr:purine-binding chemotaxis protein CheW [Vicinamibacteria bacterium]
MSDARRIARRRKDSTEGRPPPPPVTDRPSADESDPKGATPGESTSQVSTRAARTTPSPSSFLTFWIGGELFALPLDRAREIARCEAVTKVPNTPPCLRGVMNLRGTVIPVVDLAPRLDRSLTAIGARTCIVMLDVDWTGETLTMGLLVESVGHALAAAVDEPPSFGTRLRAELLAGLVPVGESFAAVLDADRALSSQELLVWESDVFQRSDDRAIVEDDAERPLHRTENGHGS